MFATIASLVDNDLPGNDGELLRVFNLGCEWDLQLAGELARAFGGSSDGLN